MKSNAPSWIASTAVSIEPNAVMTTTGSKGYFSWTTRVTSRPDVPGMRTSMISKSCPFSASRGKRLVPRGSQLDSVTFGGQGFGEKLATDFVVVGDENVRIHKFASESPRSAVLPPAGRWIETVVPWPTSLVI